MARPHPALVELAARRPLPAFDDHDALARSALEHRMGGLLWSQVLAGACTGPPEWRERLAGADVVTRARHERLWRALGDVSSRLAERDISVAAFKGVPVERRWYERTGERPCSDLDLVLHPDHLARIDAVIEVLQPGHPLRGRAGDLVATGRLQSVELLTEDGTSVDLHADVFKLWLPSRRDIVWSRTVAVDGPGGGSVRALDAEASLVQFLIHLTKDRFRWLLGCADVARVVATPDLDHEFVAWWVRAEGVEVPYRLALEAVVAALDLDVAVPSSRGPRALAWRVVWRPSIRLRGDEGLVRFRQREMWVTLLARGHTRAKLRFLGRKLVPPAELVAYRRPGSGPALWRLARGRITDGQRRWRAGRELRRPERPRRSRGRGANLSGD